MKFVALVSGGKDSIYSTLQAINYGHELLCCAHLAPPQRTSNLEDESYMYQTAGSEAVRMQVEECIGVPLYVREIHGQSNNTSLVYDDDVATATTDDSNGNGTLDEVEDLYLLLKHIQSVHPDISAVSSGAILSTYQRTRIENVCSRLNLTSLSYLWRMSSQRTLLNSILDDGEVDAVLVRVACPPGLLPYRHLGKSLRELRDRGILDQLKDRYGMHPAGEGGEYETLVVDCPKLFKYGRLVLEETDIVCDGSDDGVGTMIVKCKVEKKNAEDTTACDLNGARIIERCQTNATEQVLKIKAGQSSTRVDDASLQYIPTKEIITKIYQSMNLPNVRMMKGGLCHISALLSPVAATCNTRENGGEAHAAVQEFISIQQMLQTILTRLYPNDEPATSPQDILYVHLYLSEISHFAKINQHYQQFFGTKLPPGRSCVAVGEGALPGGRRVMMDCILQRGSGGYLRAGDRIVEDDTCDTFLKKALQNKHHALRKTLHVQSISHWAPVCIGPYSQCNVLRSSLVFLAGMIGLVPQSMTLIKPTTSSNDVASWEVQLYQSWKNAASVLDGLDDGGLLEDCLGSLVYFSTGAIESLSAHSTEQETFSWNKLWAAAQCICNGVLSNNAGVVMGSVDGAVEDRPPTDADPSLYDDDGVLYGGYEDEETWREISGAADTLLPPSQQLSSLDMPLLMVCLPELPAKAEAEVELILASRRAASCLGIFNSEVTSSTVKCGPNASTDRRLLWDTGFDCEVISSYKNHDTPSCIEVSAVARYLGLGCACVSTVMATWKYRDSSIETMDLFNFDVEEVLSQMIDSSINNAKGNGELSSFFTIGDVLNVRLYYIAGSVSQRKEENVDDGSQIRMQLLSVLRAKSKQYANSSDIPAFTVVPVLGMHLSHSKESPTEGGGSSIPLIAMQVTIVDMARMETEMWVRHNRKYAYDN